MKKALLTMFAMISIIAATVGSAFALEGTALTARVTDIAKVLSSSEAGQMEARLTDIERRTTAQIAIVIIPKLDGKDVADYAQEVFAKSKLGQAGKNNGLLIVLAIAERKARVHTGRGLEGDIPDVEAWHIIRDVMAPQLKIGHYFAALSDAVTRIEKVLTGEEQVTKKGPDEKKSKSPSLIDQFWLPALIAAICGAMHPLFGGVVGAIGFALTAFLLWASIPLTILAAIIGFIVGLFGVLLWSGGGGGGSVFGGGGGSSAGGGATGDW